MKNIRINNIECRPYLAPNVSGTLYEIVKWCDYEREEELDMDEYNFENSESCYVIAWLKVNNKGLPYIETVGDHLLDLDGAELYSFMEVYRRADEKLKQKQHLINLMNESI